MQVIKNFVGGMLSVLKIIGSPLLYRYPYRNSAEGLRSDWSHIGQDINSLMGRLEEAHDGQRTKE